MQSMEKQASDLFDKLESVFGNDRSMRERDIKVISEVLIDVGISAILADDRPAGQQDAESIALCTAAIEEGRRRVAVKKLLCLAERPHSHRFWEITEIVKEAIFLLEAVRPVRNTDRAANDRNSL